jgi:Flp pilus assembly protein TadB
MVVAATRREVTMKNNFCCNEENVSSEGKRKDLVKQHFFFFSKKMLKGAGWTIPSFLLILIPKCPACLAAYLALITGAGLSITVAVQIRNTLIILCLVSLSYIVFKLFLRARLHRFKGS